MSLDLSGQTLAQQIVTALNLPPPPVNPTPEQEAAYQTAVAAQLTTWTTICQQFMIYLVNNANLTVPAAGIEDSTSHPCTGTSTTGSIS